VKKYRSVLDCACGTCLDYFEYKKEGIPIKYKGVDLCIGLVEEAKSLGIDCDLGDIEDLPYEDESFDVVTARHILEHLDYYEKAISEMCRVARYEVLIVFFLAPQEFEVLEKDGNLNNEVNVNKYAKDKLEKYAMQFGKIEWIPAGSEIVLRIKKGKKVLVKKKTLPKKEKVVYVILEEEMTNKQVDRKVGEYE
jgi:ubiquinone/menaquinone biosynthesis C-methylase UbiE